MQQSTEEIRAASATMHAAGTVPAAANACLLVVDDDADVLKTLEEGLRRSGFDVDVAGDSACMWAAIARRRHDLVLIDLHLRDEDGHALARRLRDGSRVPIMMISGSSSEADRAAVLELAADDFVVKPFGMRELAARVRAVLRRCGPDPAGAAASGTGTPDAQDNRNCLAFGRWILNTERRQLLSRDHAPCELTPNEFYLLEAFVAHPKKVWTRDELLEHTRSAGTEVYDRVIDVLILRLRRKIESNPRQPQYICTERGQGYVFKADVVRL